MPIIKTTKSRKMNSRIPTCSHIPLSWLRQQLPITDYNCAICLRLRISKPLTRTYEDETIQSHIANSEIEDLLLDSTVLRSLAEEDIFFGCRDAGSGASVKWRRSYKSIPRVLPSLKVVVELEFIENIHSQRTTIMHQKEHLNVSKSIAGDKLDNSDDEDYIYPTLEERPTKIPVSCDICHTRKKYPKFTTKIRRIRRGRKVQVD